MLFPVIAGFDPQSHYFFAWIVGIYIFFLTNLLQYKNKVLPLQPNYKNKK
jgi:hypothetical protein